MAFLLSPKTGGGAVSYSFISNPSDTPVSINGAPAQSYTASNPGTVHPGDVISATGEGAPYSYRGGYLDAEAATAQVLKEVTGTLPYTVEEVAGAVSLGINLS